MGLPDLWFGPPMLPEAAALSAAPPWTSCAQVKPCRFAMLSGLAVMKRYRSILR